MGKKKLAIVIAIVSVVVIAAIVGIALLISGGAGSGSKEDKVYVERVGDLISVNSGSVSSYSGKVESQETWEVKKDSEKEVKEVLVEVGQSVEAGTPLFTYDTGATEMQIAQARLELEGIGNDISNYNSQIAELQKEKRNAPQDQQLEYTTQIQTLQTSLKQAEYDQKQKQVEIDNYQKSIDNATVTSKIAGVVKEINENTMDMYGMEKAYMTILATGDYRIKGSLDEQSYYYSGLSVGQDVVIRSRVDETQTWKGKISLIDTEGEASQENNGYYYEEGGEGTSKYPFYVELDSSDGLILGQHVFIEPDYGQGNELEGIWLDASYIVMDDGDPYVWAANSKNRLEKRKVELGEFNENMYMYQILSGLTEDDYITWPMYGLYEGVRTVTNEEEVDYDAPLYQQEDEGNFDNWMDGGYDYDLEEEGVDSWMDTEIDGMEVEGLDIEGTEVME